MTTTRRSTFGASRGMRTRVVVLATVLAAVASVAQGCSAENSLVDGDCAPGYLACDGVCADTRSDPDHCGSCSSRCAPGAPCVSGLCGDSLDASREDGSGGDGALADGAPGDASPGDGALADGALADGAPGDGSTVDACPPPPYVTAAACGACGIVCVAPNSACLLDSVGAALCAPPCVAPLSECSGKCVDLANDAQNCGTCGKLCPSNICAASKCQGATPGDIVVIGHDYKVAFAGSSQARVLTNAVFIPTSNPLRILSFEQFADAAVVANVKSLIASAAGGRVIKTTVTNNPAALASGVLAESYDVILIHDQQGGAPATLATSGASWATDLGTFAKAGGVIVAFDGAGGQGGMPQLLTSAKLLDVAGHQPIPAGSLVGVVAPADRIATLLVSPYGCFERSVTLQPNEPNGGNVVYVADRFVGGVAGDPVVVHKVVP